MGLWQLISATKSFRVTRRRSTVCFQLAVMLSVVAIPHAKASFIDDYAIDMFTLSNTNANGTAITPDGGLSLQLTGGNTGSGLPGTTEFTVAAAASGVVGFSFSFLSLDSKKAVCGTNSNVACDYVGYLAGTQFTQIADDTNQVSGTVSFNVAAGQTFGFEVGTADNNGEPGVLTISSFSAPEESTAAIPEPATASLALAGLAGAIGLRRWRGSIDRRKAMDGRHGSI
jgi:PEP-CTERM motif